MSARLAVAVACLTLGLACASAANATRPLVLGFSDGAFTGPAGATWLARGAAAGASIVRIDIGWDAPDTPTEPRGFDPRNPADPNYNFSTADAAIVRATRLGLRVLVTFTGAPPWAEGAGRPAGAQAGSWRPNPQALADYGIALATRYSGHFPNPADPNQMLPRVTLFQPWNEPNLSLYLSPQWVRGRPASPGIYRAMLNAFYAGVKSVDPGALVVTAGTAPYGDPQPGGQRIQPALFWRDLLCLRKTSSGGLAGTPCPDPAHFDVMAHHTYSWGSPMTHALWPDDVSIPDLGKLVTVLRAAERTGGALPHEHHPVWITEVGYNTNPPNPYGVPVAKEAQWLEETLAELWRQGASTVVWEQVGDQPPIPNYSETNQSGVYYLNGTAKPALTAFRFPLVAWRVGAAELEVWGRSPQAGHLLLQRLEGGVWRTFASTNESSGATFSTTLADRGAVSVRARIAAQTSLVWRAS